VVTKSPPRVEAETSRTRFHVRPKRQPHDGFFMSLWTLSCHAYRMSISLGSLLSCDLILHRKSGKKQILHLEIRA